MNPLPRIWCILVRWFSCVLVFRRKPSDIFVSKSSIFFSQLLSWFPGGKDVLSCQRPVLSNSGDLTRRWNAKIQHRCNRRHLSRTFTTKGKFLIFSCSYIFWNNKHLSGCLIYGVESGGHWHLVCLSRLAQVAAGPFRLSTGFTTKEEKAKEFLEVSHGPKGWPIILPIRRIRDTTWNSKQVHQTEWAPEFLSGFLIVLKGDSLKISWPSCPWYM